MKMLTATSRSQGARVGDFALAIEGELVWAPQVCSSPGEAHDSERCGCDRAFAGLASHRATTTAVVRDIPSLTRPLLLEILRASLVEQGWPPDWADDEADDLTRLASVLAEGDILERQDEVVGRRFHPVSGQLLAPLSRRR